MDSTLIAISYPLQGGTIKALVNLLNIDKKREEQRLISEEVYESFFEHLTSGIEVISGKRGRGYLGVSRNTIYEILSSYNSHFSCFRNCYNTMMRNIS